MRKLIIALILMYVLVSAGTNVNAYDEVPSIITLDQAIVMVLKHSPAVERADSALEASSARLRQNIADYFPKISIEGNYAHLYPDPTIFFPGIGPIQLYPVDNYDYHLAVHYNLFDFGKRSSDNSAARHGMENARQNALIAKENIAFHTIQVVYSIMFLQQSMQVQEQQLKSLNEHLNIIKKRQSSGSATNFDVLVTQVKVAESENSLTELSNSLAKQIIHFKQLSGIDNRTAIVFDADFSAEDEKFDETLIIDKAIVSRKEHKAAAERVSAAEAACGAANAENYPALNLAYTYGRKNGYLPVLDDLLEDSVGAAQIEIPIFNGLKTYNRIKEAKANLESAKSNLREVEETIVSEVRQTLSDLHSSREKIQATELHVKMATDALEQANVRYSNGIITNLDLLNVETSLSEARLLRLKAVFEYTLSGYALQKAIGEQLY